MGENYITCREEKGSINISEDVIISMVRSVLSEVEGVAGLSNTAGAELAELIGLKSVSKGVKVQFEDGRVVVDIIITVVYGCNIVNVAKAVQDKILSVVQATTGIENAEVTAVDKGALDCTIKARVECAVYRSCDASSANIPWGGAVR